MTASLCSRIPLESSSVCASSLNDTKDKSSKQSGTAKCSKRKTGKKKYVSVTRRVEATTTLDDLSLPSFRYNSPLPASLSSSTEHHKSSCYISHRFSKSGLRVRRICSSLSSRSGHHLLSLFSNVSLADLQLPHGTMDSWDKYMQTVFEFYRGCYDYIPACHLSLNLAHSAADASDTSAYDFSPTKTTIHVYPGAIHAGAFETLKEVIQESEDDIIVTAFVLDRERDDSDEELEAGSSFTSS